MKFEAFDDVMNKIGYYWFDSCMEYLEAPLKTKYGGSVAKVQFFSSFFAPDKTYPFMKNEVYYYPVTVIFKNKTWEVQWIKWNASALSSRYGTPPYNFEKKCDEVELCDDTPLEFIEQIAGKELVCLRSRDEAIVCVDVGYGGREKMLQSIGQVGVWLQKELQRQVPKLIEKKTGLKINRHWAVAFHGIAGFVEEKGTHYLKGHLLSFWVKAVPICVCWKGDIKPYDYIPSGSIEFDLAEQAPNCTPYTMDQLRRFIENGGTEFIEE